MLRWFRSRYLDVLGSIYIYNEHRGYTALDRVLDAVRRRSPDDAHLIGLIARHRADERKHYVMFKRWFERRGTMPMKLDRTFGHIDRFIEIMFRRTIDRLDTQAVVDRDDLFRAPVPRHLADRAARVSPGRNPSGQRHGPVRQHADPHLRGHPSRRTQPLGPL
ncbi:hypothetical protein ACFSTD_14130 [Novosphingobium colocasiae]